MVCSKKSLLHQSPKWTSFWDTLYELLAVEAQKAFSHLKCIPSIKQSKHKIGNLMPSQPLFVPILYQQSYSVFIITDVVLMSDW